MPVPNAAIGRRPDGRHLPRKPGRIPGNGTPGPFARPAIPTGVTPLLLVTTAIFCLHRAHRAAHRRSIARSLARSLAPITTTGYSAAADRVGRQQRRGRGPDPGRRDRDLPAGPGPGPAAPHHRLNNSINRHSAIVVVQVSPRLSGDSDVKCIRHISPGLPITSPPLPPPLVSRFCILQDVPAVSSCLQQRAPLSIFVSE